MTVVFDGKSSIRIAGAAHVIDDAREYAWAEKHVYRDRDLKWILGNFVQADEPNSNGHIFPLEDLRAHQATLNNKPLNLLHQERRIVGHYVANELLFPVEAADVTTPYMEALAAYYHYIFREEFEAVNEAHQEGKLFFSMECVPSRLRCAAEGCGQEFAYRGRQHESYCDHLRTQTLAKRHLIEPHFTGGALIIPPVRPGWKNADVKELTRLFTEAQQEVILAAVEEEAPHLDAATWESLMLSLVAAAR